MIISQATTHPTAMTHAYRLGTLLLAGVLALFPAICLHASTPSTTMDQTLCTEQGPVAITIVLEAPEPHHGAEGDDHCPWCTGTDGAGDPTAPTTPAGPGKQTGPITHPLDHALQPLVGLPTPRGPPAHPLHPA